MYKIINGNMLEELDKMEENSIDAIVTDPPYELNFMGKGWDNAGVSFSKGTWEKCLRVLKPGGYLLAFGGSRTFHRIACAIEDGGFEIRDTIMWLYGSGFPKSMDISKSIDKRSGVHGKKIGERTFGKTSTGQNSGWHNNNIAQLGKQDVFEPATELAKQWQGWGSQLKPSFEPIIIARKQFKGSLVDNIIEYGVGGINIDECRVESEERTIPVHSSDEKEDNTLFGLHPTIQHERIPTTQGRFPANTILTYDQITFDEVCGGFPIRNKPNGSISKQYKMNNQVYGDYGFCNTWEAYQDSGSASRYFYCAKASKKDRDEGLEEFEIKTKVFNGKSDTSSTDIKDVEQRFTTYAKNIHPTVKPTSLMQYLVRLVSPKGAIILDPFMGSGSTGKAVVYENKERQANYIFIGIELNKEYCDIAEARIKYISQNSNCKDNNNIEDIEDVGNIGDKTSENTKKTLFSFEI